MIWLIIIGIVSGVISGMGIGGGTVLIPALTILYGFGQQSAQNINLIYFLPTAAIAIMTHVKNGNIETKVMWKLIVFGMAGALAGSLIAVRMEDGVLRKLFGFFLLAMGIMEIFKKESREQEDAPASM